jgi:hypothetical protein
MMKFGFVLLILWIAQVSMVVQSREIDHVVIREKIDRIGSLQSGGEGKRIMRSYRLLKRRVSGDTGKKLAKEIYGEFKDDFFPKDG